MRLCGRGFNITMKVVSLPDTPVRNIFKGRANFVGIRNKTEKNVVKKVLQFLIFQICRDWKDKVLSSLVS